MGLDKLCSKCKTTESPALLGLDLRQTEELLVKRRDLLEKKIGLELQRAKELSAAKNKRGEWHSRLSCDYSTMLRKPLEL